MSAPFLLSTTWWAHNPQFHRIETWLSRTTLFLKLFVTLGFVCNSRATFRVIINYAIKHITYTRRLVSGNDDCLSASIFLRYLLTLLSVCFICSTREILLWSFLGYPPRWFSLIRFNCCKAAPCLFVSTMEFLKKGGQLHHDDLKQKNEDVNVMEQPLQEEQPRPRTLPRIS